MATTLSTDLGTNALKVYAAEMLRTALPTMKWMKFAVIREDLTGKPGTSVVIRQPQDLTGDAKTSGETSTPTADKLTWDTDIEISVDEYLKPVEISEEALQISNDDEISEAVHRLGRHYSTWGPERLLATTVAEGAGTTIYGGNRSSRATVTSSDVMDVEAILNATEELEGNDVPKFQSGGDEFYVCVLSNHQTRHLKDDPRWISANNYHRTRNVFTGEVGRIDSVVFIESSAAFRGSAGSGNLAFFDANDDTTNDLSTAAHGGAVDLYMANVFGDASYAFVPAVPVELRQRTPSEYSRLHGIAWYSVYGAGVLRANHIVNIETA